MLWGERKRCQPFLVAFGRGPTTPGLWRCSYRCYQHPFSSAKIKQFHVFSLALSPLRKLKKVALVRKNQDLGESWKHLSFDLRRKPGLCDFQFLVVVKSTSWMHAMRILKGKVDRCYEFHFGKAGFFGGNDPGIIKWDPFGEEWNTTNVW